MLCNQVRGTQVVSWGWVLMLFIKNEPREARLGQTRASNIFRKRKRKISFWDKQQQCERDRLAVLPLQVNGSSSNKSQTSLLVTQHSHSNHGDPNVECRDAQQVTWSRKPALDKLFPQKGTARVRLSQDKCRRASRSH